MLSLDLARKLADAGFDWTPSERDTFIIPDAGMDHKIFVISELQASVYPYFGVQHIMFHGTSEWALDQVMVEDAVWLPSESQLRTAIEERTPDSPYMLERTSDGYRCIISDHPGDSTSYPSAEDAYGIALLTLIGVTTKAA